MRVLVHKGNAYGQGAIDLNMPARRRLPMNRREYPTLGSGATPGGKMPNPDQAGRRRWRTRLRLPAPGKPLIRIPALLVPAFKKMLSLAHPGHEPDMMLPPGMMVVKDICRGRVVRGVGQCMGTRGQGGTPAVPLTPSWLATKRAKARDFYGQRTSEKTKSSALRTPWWMNFDLNFVSATYHATSFVLYKRSAFLIQSKFLDIFLLEIFSHDRKIADLLNQATKAHARTRTA